MLMSRFPLSLTSMLSLSRPPLLLLLQLLPMLLPLWVMLLPLLLMLLPLLVMLLPLLAMPLLLLPLATPLLPQLIPTPPTHTPFKSRFYTLLLSILHFGLENRDTSRHKTRNVTRRSFRVTT